MQQLIIMQLNECKWDMFFEQFYNKPISNRKNYLQSVSTLERNLEICVF